MKSPENETHVNHLTYLGGFTLALVLTLLAFALVIAGAGVPFGSITPLVDSFHNGAIFTGKMSHRSIMAGIFILAFAQILVHLRFFLHLGFSPSQRWNMLTILFTLLIIVIMAGGTLWIVFSSNDLMTPSAQN